MKSWPNATTRFLLVALVGVCGLASCHSAQPRTNDLGIIIVEYPDDPRVVCLPHDHGFLIRWYPSEKPELYLYDKPANRIRCASDFAEFLDGLTSFPSGSKVDEISLCCGGTSKMGMSEAEFKKLREIIRQKRFHMTDHNEGNFCICTCQSTQVRLLEKAK